MLLKPVIPVFQYVINYEYISEVLCINKEKPEMHCNGKCHLMQEMAKASETEKPLSSDKKTSHSEIEVLFIEEITDFNFFQKKEIFSSIPNSFYCNLYTPINCDSVFHPPSYS